MRKALVMSGGGVRGAYEVGVLQGIADVLGRLPAFEVFVGSSVGAINAAFLASRAHQADRGIADLVETWQSLRLRTHFRPTFRGLFQPTSAVRKWFGPKDREHYGRSLLDPRPLESIITDSVNWSDLRRNVDSSLVHSVIVPTLDLATGRTVMFADVAPKGDFRPSRDPRRMTIQTQLEGKHILASSAIPLVFPTRRIGDSYYCDGGIRFNTPIAPAIRAGADRLVVISLGYVPGRNDEPIATNLEYPSITFLVGKLLNALLLDPIAYDLQILKRFNRMIEVLDDELDDDEFRRVQTVFEETRGLPYRLLKPLVFAPSADIGHIALEALNLLRRDAEVPTHVRALLRALWRSRESIDADLASYLLFDGTYTGRLIALGRSDAKRMAGEIQRFFAES